jgi:putative ABC transport system substrate-binding protein
MTVTIGRRELIAALSSAAAWPLAARAQQSGKLPTIGVLGANNASFERASTDAFVQRLRELGWIENRTIAIEYRWAEGRDERFAEIAAEFIRLKVDVILTYATPSSLAAKTATAVIPIVFAAAGDPVGTGLVASLARPGGNVTGLSIQQTDLASKRLEMLREVLPVLRTVDRRRRPRCHENNENHLWGENHSSPTHQRHWQHQQAFEEIRTGDE